MISTGIYSIFKIIAITTFHLSEQQLNNEGLDGGRGGGGLEFSNQ